MRLPFLGAAVEGKRAPTTGEGPGGAKADSELIFVLSSLLSALWLATGLEPERTGTYRGIRTVLTSFIPEWPDRQQPIRDRRRRIG